jgi:hypothetical protein
MVYRKLKGIATPFDCEKILRKKVSEGVTPSTRDLIRHRPFLIQPLRDPAKHKAYIKGRQIGVSEIMLTEALWFLHTHPKSKVMHTFPREGQMHDFSNTRIAEALEETDRIRELVGKPNQVQTKKIAEAFYFLRSAWESGLGEGVDVDMVVFDEKDRMKEGVEIAFKESLSSSAYGLIREISTPTLPGRGVDVAWQRSDKKEWYVPCTKCGMEQVIRYPDNIVKVKDFPESVDIIPDGGYDYLCSDVKCRGKLDRWVGRWIPRHPERTLISGYHIPQFIAPWITATEVMQKRIDYKFESLWLNYVAGLTSLGDSILLTDSSIKACQVNYKYPVPYRTQDFSRISVGIDWGNANYCVVVGENRHNKVNYLLNAFSVT